MGVAVGANPKFLAGVGVGVLFTNTIGRGVGVAVDPGSSGG